jgi:hypothetical protein
MTNQRKLKESGGGVLDFKATHMKRDT